MLVRRVLAIAPVPVAVVAVLLPWSESGSTARSAFALAHSLEGIGTMLPAWEEFALRASVALPVIVACSLAAAVLGRVRLSAALGVVTGTLVVSASILAIVELGSSARLGPWVGGIGCALAMVVGLIEIVRRSPRSA